MATFWSLLEPDEKPAVYLLIASFWGAVIAIIPSSLALSWSGQAIGVFSVGISTLLMCLIMQKKWGTRVNSRPALPTSEPLFTIRFLTWDCLFAIGWIIVSVIMTVSISEDSLSESYSRFISNAKLLWVQSLWSWIMSSLLWAILVSGIYHRYQFFKRSQSPQPADPQNKILLEPHTKWILGLILICMGVSIIEFNLSLGDGRYGEHSVWLLLIVGVLTFFLHSITLYLWRRTAKKRRGTTIPPFIYSITLAVLTALLAALWLAASAVSIALRKVDIWYYSYTIYWEGTYSTEVHAGYFKMLEHVRLASGVLALVVSILMWVQVGLIVHFRKRFFHRVNHARNVSQSTAETNIAQVNGNGNPNFVTIHPSNPIPYATQYSLPVTPEPAYNPELMSQQRQAIYITNPGPSSPIAYNPALPMSPVYNPVLQPSSPPIGMMPLNPMFQKDEGK